MSFLRKLFRNPYRVQAEQVAPPEPPPLVHARTSKDREHVTEFEMTFFLENKCPDCEHEGFLEGPHGCLSINFKCANPACGSRFNHMGPFGIDRISDASPDKVPQ
jgi:ribosomal protein S27E